LAPENQFRATAAGDVCAAGTLVLLRALHVILRPVKPRTGRFRRVLPVPLGREAPAVSPRRSPSGSFGQPAIREGISRGPRAAMALR
jgi:hypothetical protein